MTGEQSLYKSLPLHTVFIYLTERCNLQCGYCYIQHKSGRDLPYSLAIRFLDLVAGVFPVPPRRFVISGGEVFLRWKELKRLSGFIVNKFPGSRISIQTNGLLLTTQRIRLMKRLGISLEIGIDGDMATTTRWRGKMSAADFKKLIGNIKRCVDAGIDFGCNMTVHPAEAGRIQENVIFLRSLGVRAIDITPAAFMPWDEISIGEFKERYTTLLRDGQNGDHIYMGEDWDLFSKPIVDLSLHPPGYVLCGDAFLCLPDALRKRWNLWDVEHNELRSQIMKDVMCIFEIERQKLKRRSLTYRDHICLSFNVVNSMCDFKYVNVEQMIPLMRFLTRVNLEHRLNHRALRANGI